MKQTIFIAIIIASYTSLMAPQWVPAHDSASPHPMPHRIEAPNPIPAPHPTPRDFIVQFEVEGGSCTFMLNDLELKNLGFTPNEARMNPEQVKAVLIERQKSFSPEIRDPQQASNDEIRMSRSEARKQEEAFRKQVENIQQRQRELQESRRSFERAQIELIRESEGWEVHPRRPEFNLQGAQPTENEEAWSEIEELENKLRMIRHHLNQNDALDVRKEENKDKIYNW